MFIEWITFKLYFLMECWRMSVILPSILKPQWSNSIMCVLVTQWVLNEWLFTVQCDCLYLVYLLRCYSISLASPVLGYNPPPPPQWREYSVRDFFSSSLSSLKWQYFQAMMKDNILNYLLDSCLKPLEDSSRHRLLNKHYCI